jgi:hypothetical protein
MNDFDQVLENWDYFLDDNTEDFDDVKIVEED